MRIAIGFARCRWFRRRSEPGYRGGRLPFVLFIPISLGEAQAKQSHGGSSHEGKRRWARRRPERRHRCVPRLPVFSARGGAHGSAAKGGEDRERSRLPPRRSIL